MAPTPLQPLVSAVAISAARRALFFTSAILVTRLRPPVRLKMASRRKGRHRLAGDPGGVGATDRGLDVGHHLVGGDFVGGGNRIGDEHAAAERRVRRARGRTRRSRRDRRGGSAREGRFAATRRPGTRRCHSRRPARPKRLQHLERLRQVEERLGAGGDDDDVGPGEFGEVGRDVEARLGAAMDAADAAGREDADAGEPGHDHGRGDGGRAWPAG